MGKNYTVYIKHDEFQREPNKSGLLNALLTQHYSPVTDHAIPAKPNKKNLDKVLDDGVWLLNNEPTYTDSEETA